MTLETRFYLSPDEEAPAGFGGIPVPHDVPALLMVELTDGLSIAESGRSAIREGAGLETVYGVVGNDDDFAIIESDGRFTRKYPRSDVPDIVYDPEG